MATISGDELDGFMTGIGGGVTKERRRSKRMPYASLGMIAPYDGLGIPSDESFWPVQCRDLSRGGISFYSAVKPACPSLVVCLGSVGDASCIIACRVIHCTSVGDEGASNFLVGCEFVERLN
ncbi:MAG TPA: PilZ domain-containing protein [Pirellulales bacterium]|nr:PilZ domain-containing protein [Pirellulales bacterium]